MCITSFTYSQVNPCSINAGSPISICNTDNSFFLDGEIGSNVDLSTLQWSTDNPILFSINDDSNIDSGVILSTTPAPVGCYTFTLTGTCVSGEVLVSDVEVCILSEPTIPDITVGGVSLSEITVCNEVILQGDSNLEPNESAIWFWDSIHPRISVSTPFMQPDNIRLSLGNRYFDECVEQTVYYQIDNGGCVSIDTIVITYIGQDQGARIKRPLNNATICDSNVEISTSNLGCNSTLSDFSLTLLNQGNYTNLPIQTSISLSRDCLLYTSPSPRD